MSASSTSGKGACLIQRERLLALQAGRRITNVARERDVTVDETIEFFQRRKQQCEALLKHAQTPPFRLVEMTPSGQRDVTAAHIEQLKGDRDTYQQAIDYLLASGRQSSA